MHAYKPANAVWPMVAAFVIRDQDEHIAADILAPSVASAAVVVQLETGGHESPAIIGSGFMFCQCLERFPKGQPMRRGIDAERAIDAESVGHFRFNRGHV
jgi:hypothetical protein